MAKKNGTSAGKVNDTPLTAVPAGTEMDIPIGMIVADDEFNARKDLGGKTDEGHSIGSLAESIKRDSQIAPVLVAVLKDYPGKYFLVSGFRRFYAISRSKEEGGLGLNKIRATVYQPVDKKGDPVETTLAELKYLNLIENEARKALNPYERALRYHDLVKNHEDTGNQIAKRVSLDPSYVNRLVAAMDMHPKVIERWKTEQSPNYEGSRVLTTDHINKLTHMKIKDRDGKSTDRQDHESQLKWLEDTLNPVSTVNPDGTEGEGDSDSAAKDASRASLAQIKKAIFAANLAYKNANNAKDQARIEAILEGLKFAVKPSKIDGVLTLADKGKTIKGPDGKAVAAPRS